ncbi:MAG: NAD-dependent epimerase/dehydratase family protein [Candidatus Bathyarchaeia archaeon]
MCKRILLTGATGALGPTILSELIKNGHIIRVFTRKVPDKVLLPPEIELELGDITDAKAISNALRNIDTVVHMAALLHVVKPPSSLVPEYERVNIEGTRIVVETAIKNRVQRLIFFSTIAVYGSGQGRLLTEDSEPAPDTPYAKSKLAGEKLVLAARRFDGQPFGVVLRLGAVYGARIKGNYRQLVLALATNRFIPIGKGENRRTLVYDKDVARAVLLTIHHPGAAGRIYNVTDGQVHTIREINQAICAALHRKPPKFYLPVGPVRAVAGLIEDAAYLVRRPSPVGRATIDKYIEDMAVDGQRIQTELGFRPAYDLYTGWADAIQQMRRQGIL